MILHNAPAPRLLPSSRGAFVPALVVLLLVSVTRCCAAGNDKKPPNISAGFAEINITPKLGKKPVYIAGFGHNRIAAKIHDPLLARVVVLADGSKKIALVSVDLVGVFFETVERIRAKFAGFDYILVSSTHNHEGPDTLGLWGANPFKSGVNPDYLRFVENQIAAAVKKADQAKAPVTAQIGTARGPELLHDSRKPIVKHDELVALKLQKPSGELCGIVVQWNCHPETLGSRNKEISADFVGPTVSFLQKRFKCPVVFFTGTVGGLMTSLRIPVRDEKGKQLRDGTWEKTERYGHLVGKLAERALQKPKSIRLAPIHALSRRIFLPIDNKLYIFGRSIGVLNRQAWYWQDNVYKAGSIKGTPSLKKRLCVQSEIGLVQLGQLQIAAIPGEIYPELVLGKVEDPARKGADYPKAPIEPAIFEQMTGPYKMLVGLANDELGYILPKRQWDAKPPYCYGLKKAPYGEINSLGAETAPLLCTAFRLMAGGKK